MVTTNSVSGYPSRRRMFGFSSNRPKFGCGFDNLIKWQFGLFVEITNHYNIFVLILQDFLSCI